MEQTIENLKNKDIQIELRKNYYDNLSSEKKELGQKGAHIKSLCYCNIFHGKTSGITKRHTLSKTHQDYFLKIKSEEKKIKEKNPEYILCGGEFLYNNQFIKYYYFTTIYELNKE